MASACRAWLGWAWILLQVTTTTITTMVRSNPPIAADTRISSGSPSVRL